MKNILIFGFGKWSKKIIKYLKLSKKFKKVYVKTTSKFFEIYPKYKIINFQNFKTYLNDFKYIHICTNTETHFQLFKLYNFNQKNLIVEKPLVNSENELKNIKFYFSSNKIIIDYIYLYSPIFKKFKYKFNSKSDL